MGNTELEDYKTTEKITEPIRRLQNQKRMDILFHNYISSTAKQITKPLRIAKLWTKMGNT